MQFFNKLFGGIISTLVFLPIILLAAVSRLFNFIDLFFRRQIAAAFWSLFCSPFTALYVAFIGIMIIFEHGWRVGVVDLFKSLQTRLGHFFKKQLLFGSKEGESLNQLFVNSNSSGKDSIVTPGFFGKVTLKLLSLCCSMEVYLASNASDASPHSDVSIYYTEHNINLLVTKYGAMQKQQAANLSEEIKNYLTQAQAKVKLSLEEINRSQSNTGDTSGRRQSAEDELVAIQAAQRCFDNFSKNAETAPDLDKKFNCTTLSVMHYVWLAITAESASEASQNILKEKVVWTLFQIQRGFNIVHEGTEDSDMPECPSGAIGLLTRILCDDKVNLPGSSYTAPDPNPSNLSLVLKRKLDAPFVSDYNLMAKIMRANYKKDPVAYKQEQQKNITNVWKTTYAPLLKSGVLQQEGLEQIIEAGVRDWEPPEAAISAP